MREMLLPPLLWTPPLVYRRASISLTSWLSRLVRKESCFAGKSFGHKIRCSNFRCVCQILFIYSDFSAYLSKFFVEMKSRESEVLYYIKNSYISKSWHFGKSFMAKNKKNQFLFLNWRNFTFSFSSDVRYWNFWNSLEKFQMF